ncbi:MAG: hypothetical protein II953_06360 [Clostridia bacterium]|nr:hypothetical protein [Clostridia bacterium]
MKRTKFPLIPEKVIGERGKSRFSSFTADLFNQNSRPLRPDPMFRPNDFDRAALSACLSESQTVREDEVLFSASRPRVPCNARLNLCRRQARLRDCVDAAQGHKI